jgi:hypothetical protein
LTVHDPSLHPYYYNKWFNERIPLNHGLVLWRNQKCQSISSAEGWNQLMRSVRFLPPSVVAHVVVGDFFFLQRHNRNQAKKNLGVIYRLHCLCRTPQFFLTVTMFLHRKGGRGKGNFFTLTFLPFQVPSHAKWERVKGT